MLLQQLEAISPLPQISKTLGLEISDDGKFYSVKMMCKDNDTSGLERVVLAVHVLTSLNFKWKSTYPFSSRWAFTETRIYESQQFQLEVILQATSFREFDSNVYKITCRPLKNNF